MWKLDNRVKWTPVSRRVHVHATISEKLRVHVHVHATIFKKNRAHVHVTVLKKVLSASAQAF